MCTMEAVGCDVFAETAVSYTSTLSGRVFHPLTDGQFGSRNDDGSWLIISHSRLMEQVSSIDQLRLTRAKYTVPGHPSISLRQRHTAL